MGTVTGVKKSALIGIRTAFITICSGAHLVVYVLHDFGDHPSGFDSLYSSCGLCVKK